MSSLWIHAGSHVERWKMMGRLTTHGRSGLFNQFLQSVVKSAVIVIRDDSAMDYSGLPWLGSRPASSRDCRVGIGRRSHQWSPESAGSARTPAEYGSDVQSVDHGRGSVEEPSSPRPSAGLRCPAQPSRLSPEDRVDAARGQLAQQLHAGLQRPIRTSCRNGRENGRVHRESIQRLVEKFNFPPVALPLIYVVLKDHGSDYEEVKNLLLEAQEEILNLSVREGSEMPWLLPAHLYSASALCAPINSIGHLAPLQYQLGFAYHPGAAAAPHPHPHPHHHHHHHPGAGAAASTMAGLFPHHLHLPYQLALGPTAGALPGAPPPAASPEPAAPFSLRSSGNVSPTS